MAEIDYMEDFGGSDQDRPGLSIRLARWVNLSGALVSLMLVGGLSVWGYKLLMRDVTGVPVVQAMEGAFRVAPDDPGGMRAAHQGLAVNEIAAIGGASGPVDTVTLAPPPIALTDDDRTPSALVEEASESRKKAAAPTEDPAEPDALALVQEGDDVDSAFEDVPEGALATDMAVAQALAGSEGTGDFDAPDLAGSDLEAPDQETDVSVSSGSGAVSPRPPRRPARPSLSPELAQAVAPVPDATEVAVSELAAGTQLVQLGAFGTDDMARSEWIRIAGRFPDYFDGKRRVVQQAESGGKTFYRLRAEGFSDLSDTRRFCTALVAGSADCIPVALR